MIQKGPYSYREHDDYSGFDFTKIPLPDDPTTLRDGVKMIFNQTAVDSGNNPKDLDEPIYQVSQAVQGIWY